jgi:hypothetical protein
LLYVYRVLLKGIHLMRTGVIEANFMTLNDRFQLGFGSRLTATKPRNENRMTACPYDLVIGLKR